METGWLRIYFDSNAYTTMPATGATTAASICAQLCKKKQMHPDAAQQHALFVTDAANEHVFERRLSGSEHPLEVQEKIRKHGNLDHFKLHFRALDEAEPTQRTSDGDSLGGGVGGGAEASGVASVGAGSLEDKQAGESSDDEMFGSSAPTASPTPSSRPPLLHGSSSGSIFSASTRALIGPNAGSASMPQPLGHAAQAMAADPSIVRCGYLDKRGKRNTAWKERWFVLRSPPSGANGAASIAQLSYYKSHLSAAPIATIPLVDAFVRPCHTGCVGGHLLPFEAAPSVTNLTLSPALPVPHAHSSLSKCSLEFQIDTLSRMFFMRARSYPEMHAWVQAVKAHLAPCAENALIDECQAAMDAQEFAECDLEEKRLAHIMTLQGLLKDAIGIEQFVQFETENHSEENVLFYLESEGYHQSCVSGNKSPAQLLERARSIFVNFLEAGAPQEIHIPGEARNSIRAAIQAGDIHPALFQACQQSVFSLLQASSFANFLQSKHFQRAMLKLSIIGPSYNGSGATEPASSSPETGTTLFPAHQRQRSSGIIVAPHGTSIMGAASMLDESATAHLGVPSARNNALVHAQRAQAQGQGRAAGGGGKDPLSVVHELDSAQAGGGAHSSEEPSSVDESHSLSGAAVPAPAVSILSSLYGVAPALGSALSAAAFGPTTNTTSVHSSDAAAAAAAAGTTPLSHGPVGPLNSTNMSPASLAAYLESIGEMDAIRRSETVTTRQQHSAAGGADADPNARTGGGGGSGGVPRRSSRGGSTGEGDSDSESEAEDPEEEGMFGTTPKPGSILDDADRASVSHSSTPQRGGSHAKSSAGRAASSPLVNVVTEESDFFSSSRTRSTESVTHMSTHTHTVHASSAGSANSVTTTTTTTSTSSASASVRHLSAISEDAVRGSPSHSINEGQGGAFITPAAPFVDEHDDALMAPVAPRGRGTTMAGGAPPSVLLPVSPIAPTASPAASAGSGGISASGAGGSSSSTKWKKNRSIFDDDDEEQQPASSRGVKSSPAPSPAATAKPVPSPAHTTATAPSSSLVASTIDLDLLQQETVDIADLNLDLADADTSSHANADDGDMF